jgi:rare lipoprotein A
MLARASAIVVGCLLLANCSSSSKLTSRVDPKYGVTASPRVVELGQPVPKGGGVYRVGKPYMVGGREYVPEENRSYRREGLASWYGNDFHGRLTANGEVYDMEAISAAHPTMPMPSYARVTNLKTRKSLIVRVNDRGPYHANREIDVSSKAAELLGFKGYGVAQVRVEYVGPAPIQGTDDRVLISTLREGQPAPAPPSVMVASNRFLPNFGRTPSAAMGNVPMPQDRPYDLGQGEGRYASAYPQRSEDVRVAVNEALARQRSNPQLVDISPDTEPPVSVVRRGRAPDFGAAGAPRGPWNPQPTQEVTPVSAYAPAYEPSRAVATGRGLY